MFVSWKDGDLEPDAVAPHRQARKRDGEQAG
jgi:hypothetical protein